MTADTPRSSLSLAILGLIALQPSSGYDLRRLFLTTPMGHFSSSPGAIYPALHQLERRGLIAGTVEKQNTLRPRQVFAITSKGMKALRARLSQPITQEDVKWRLDDLILRFSFMGEVLGKQRSLRFIDDLVVRIKQHILTLKQHLETERGRMPMTGVYALEQGILKYQATADWGRRVIEDLTKRRTVRRKTVSPRGKGGRKWPGN